MGGPPFFADLDPINALFIDPYGFGQQVALQLFTFERHLIRHLLPITNRERRRR